MSLFSQVIKKKSVLAGIISSIILVGVIGSNKGWWDHSSLSTSLTKKSVQAAAKRELPLTEIDSDGDGLPDWKEVLYGSDIHNKDTDADGATDGEEVRTGRDPVKKGPDDKLSYLQDKDFATSTTDLTGLRKEFFAKYLAKSSQEVKEQTAVALAKKFDASKYQPTTQLLNLSITSDNSPEALKKYGNDFGKLIEKYSVRSSRTEEEIVGDAMKTKNSETLRELQYPAVNYRNFAKDLRQTSVPLSLAKAHLQIINGYDIMGSGLIGMQLLFSDPVNGSGAYQAYVKSRVDVTLGYANIVRVFKDKNITFDSTDPGSPFTTALKK